ncbi:MAG TPA: DUF4321 domain-containing protein [Oscillospiraceae bacterium]|nr:DUF4321 domain-containing protein [Oscillospiraceae bacterium]
MAYKSNAGSWKKTIAFIFFLLAGIAVGSAVSTLCADVSWLDWLSWGRTIGINTSAPMVLDLIIAKIAFGFTFTISVAQIFFVIIFMLLFSKLCKNM